MAFKAMRCAAAMLSFALGLAAPFAHSESHTAALGKQRAAASPLEWEIREAGHPVLGNIRFAFLKKVVVTPVGKDHVFSGAYVSCQKDTRKIALELTNTIALDDPGGLRPNRMPRLLCKRPAPQGDASAVQDELPATWQLNEMGDALARGLDPTAMRECTSIGIVQDVALPQAWERKTAQVLFEIAPYNRELDSVFATCGELSAYAPAAAKVAGPAWRTARVISGGKTNVRSEPNTRSAVVVQLEPGAAILVQKAKGVWLRARQKSGAPFDGYVREDRLAVKP